MGIVDNKKLRFVKKSFNSIDDAKAYATNGRMVFDSAHKVICVDGEMYGETGGNTQIPVFMSSTNLMPWQVQNDGRFGGEVAYTPIFGWSSTWDDSVEPGSNDDSVDIVDGNWITQDGFENNPALVEAPVFASEEYDLYMPAFIMLTGNPSVDISKKLDTPAYFVTQQGSINEWYVCSFDNTPNDIAQVEEGHRTTLAKVPANLLAGDRIIFGMFMGSSNHSHGIFLVLSKIEANLPGEGISILNPDSPLANVIELDLATDEYKGGIRTGHSTNSNLATGLKTAVKLEEEGNVTGRAFVEVGKANATKYGVVRLGYTVGNTGLDLAVQAQGGTDKLFIQGAQASSNKYGMVKVGYTDSAQFRGLKMDANGRAYVELPIAGIDTLGVVTLGYDDSSDKGLRRAVEAAPASDPDNKHKLFVQTPLATQNDAGTIRIKHESATDGSESSVKLDNQGKAYVDVNVASNDAIGSIKTGYTPSGDGRDMAIYVQGGTNKAFAQGTVASDSKLGMIKTGYQETGGGLDIKVQVQGGTNKAYVQGSKASSTKYGMVKLGYQESGDGRDMAVQAQGGTDKIFVQGAQASNTKYGMIKTGHTEPNNGTEKAVVLDGSGKAYVGVGVASDTAIGSIKTGYQETGSGLDIKVQVQGGTNKAFVQSAQAADDKYGMIKTGHQEPLNRSEKSVQLDAQGAAFVTPGVKSKDQYGEGRIGFTSMNPALKPVMLDPNNREYVDIADHCEYELISGSLNIVKEEHNSVLNVYKCKNTYDGSEYLVTDMKDYGAIAHNYSVGLTGIQGGHTYGFAFFKSTAGKLAFKIHLRPNGSSEHEFVYPFAMTFDTPPDATYAFSSGLEWKFRIFGTSSELWTAIEVPESFNGDIYFTDFRYTISSGSYFGLLYSNNNAMAKQGVHTSYMSASVERPALNVDGIMGGWTEWTADSNGFNMHTLAGYNTLGLTKEQLIPLPVDIIYDGDIAFASADLHTTFYYGCGSGRDISVIPDNQFTGWADEAPTYDASVADSEARRVNEMTMIATGTVNNLRPATQGVDEVAQIEGIKVDAKYDNPTKTAGDIVAYSDVTIGNLKISRGQKIPAGNFLENIIRKMITAIIYPSPATAPKINSVTGSTTTYAPIVTASTDTAYRSVTTKKFTMSYSNGVFDPLNWCEQTQPTPNATLTPVMSATNKIGYTSVPANGTSTLAAVTTKIALGQNKYTVSANLAYGAPSNRPIRNDGAASNVTGDANDHTVPTSNSSVWAASSVTNTSSYYQTYGLMPVFTNYATGADAASTTIKGQTEYVLAYSSGASATTSMNTTARNPNNTSNRIVFRIPAGNGSVSCWWWVPGTVSGVHFWNSLTQVWENTASGVTQEHVVLTFAGRNWKYTLVKIKATDHAAADWRITLGTNFHADPGSSW